MAGAGVVAYFALTVFFTKQADSPLKWLFGLLMALPFFCFELDSRKKDARQLNLLKPSDPE